MVNVLTKFRCVCQVSPSCSVDRGTRRRGKSMDLSMDTRRSVEDFRKGGRRRACVVGLNPAARVNITSMAAKFSSRRHKHKHPIEAAAGARLPPILRPSTHETIRKLPRHGSSRPRAPASVTHAPFHVLRFSPYQKIQVSQTYYFLFPFHVFFEI